jgi:chromosomal replication initiator protein
MVESPHPGDGWNLFQDILKANVTPITWQTWLRPLRSGDTSSDTVTVLAPTDFHLRWLLQKYGDLLMEAAHASYGPDVALELVADPESPRGADIELDEAADFDPILPVAVNVNGSSHGGGYRLVGKYSFENFVVGPSNRFAHAASMAVAEQPGSHYNPLFIYGGAGLGKTHLLNAVGHSALELYPGCVVR